MGILHEKIREQEIEKEKKDAATLEQLKLLQCVAKNKINFYKKEMEAEFQRAKQEQDSWSIVGRPLQYEAQYRVNVHDGIDSEIEESVSMIFQFDKASLVKAISTMVKRALREIIITTDAGESEHEGFFIVPYNNAIVRTDIRVWRYNFSSSGVMGNIQNAFCFIASKSIIDHTRLTPSELIYFITEALQGAELPVVAKYIDELSEVWKKIETLSSDTVYKNSASLILKNSDIYKDYKYSSNPADKDKNVWMKL